MAAPPYLYSGPSPVASLATVLAGLELNERRGDAIRAEPVPQDPDDPRPRRLARRVHPEPSGTPIIELPLADRTTWTWSGRCCGTAGIYVTLAPYPGVPREEVGFRIQVTAANTDDEVSELLATLDRLADVVPLRGDLDGTGTADPNGEERDDTAGVR